MSEEASDKRHGAIGRGFRYRGRRGEARGLADVTQPLGTAPIGDRGRLREPGRGGEARRGGGGMKKSEGTEGPLSSDAQEVSSTIPCKGLTNIV